MAATITYPTSAELLEIEQDLMPRLTEDRPPFRDFPQRTTDSAYLIWRQRDDYIGLQQIRGLNGAPPRVKSIGAKEFLMQPGIYGEYHPIEEQELTLRAQLATWNRPVAVDDLVREAQEFLLQRRLDRIELILWTLQLTGTFSVANTEGGITHTDSFPIQSFTPIVPWSTPGTSTPLADMRIMQLRARGHSVRFDSTSTIRMNQQTLNWILANTNAADFYGRRTQGLGTFNVVGEVNKLLAGDNLPTIEVYEGTYKDEEGVTRLFLPDGYFVIVGKRPAGQPIGEYRYVRNANNAGMAAGPYTKVIDNGERTVPREIQVHDGHNGGPVIYFPSAIISGYVGP